MKRRALASLAIERIAFDDLDGNTQGYATARKVSINPLAVPCRTRRCFMNWRTLSSATLPRAINDGSERTPRNIREVGAESLVLLCCESLGLPGAEFSRGYIQSRSDIPERSAQRISHAADLILKAGVSHD